MKRELNWREKEKKEKQVGKPYLEFIKQIVKLPTLKKGYEFRFNTNGGITIVDKHGNHKLFLYFRFIDVIHNKIHNDIESYEKYLAKPKYKTFNVLEDWD